MRRDAADLLACIAIALVLFAVVLAYLIRQFYRSMAERWKMNEEPSVAFRIVGGLIDWGWLVLLAIWGGTAAYIERMRKNNLSFSIVTLVGDWVVSGFVGILTAYLMMEAGASFYATAAACGISGHQGGRATAFIVNQIRDRRPG